MKKNKILYSILIIVLILGALIMLFPFFWMITTSFKTQSEAVAIPPTLFPQEFTVDAYFRLFEAMPVFLYMKNTLILVAFAFFGVFLSGMAGYGFAKYNFKYKELWFLLVLTTMMIPYQVIMIPNFITINTLNLVDTYLGMALPSLVTGFGIFLFRQFMTAIPDEVIESGRIEGASEIRIFFKIILPMAKPVFAIQFILAFIASWNSFLWPLIVAQSQDMYTLSVGLSLLEGQHVADIPVQMAGATLMIIPVLIVFAIFQKHILDGYNMSGIK